MGMNPLGDLMESTMEKLREMVKVDTVIGNPIMTPDGVTLIPISKVSFGFASFMLCKLHGVFLKYNGSWI